jgi:hypothetical protein
VETQNGTGKDPSDTDDKNQIENRFISSHTFHRTSDERVQEITAEEQFEPRILESFDPVTQKSYCRSPATFHTQLEIETTKITVKQIRT